MSDVRFPRKRRSCRCLITSLTHGVTGLMQTCLMTCHIPVSSNSEECISHQEKLNRIHDTRDAALVANIQANGQQCNSGCARKQFKKPRDMSKVRCFNCNQYGHFKRNFPEPLKDTDNEKSNSRCAAEGHCAVALRAINLTGLVASVRKEVPR